MASFSYPKKATPLKTTDPLLRQNSQEVRKDMFADKHFQRFLDDMIDYVYGRKRSKDTAEGGKPFVIGLAAIQLGVPLRVCVVNMAVNVPDHFKEKYYDMRVIVNPKILSISKESDVDTESCVNCPEMWASVRRPKVVTIDCQDRWGNKMRIEGKDDLAKLFHHEIDHMNGHLFIDRVPANQIHWVKDGEELRNYHGNKDWPRIVPQEMYGEQKFVRN